MYSDVELGIVAERQPGGSGERSDEGYDDDGKGRMKHDE